MDAPIKSSVTAGERVKASFFSFYCFPLLLALLSITNFLTGVMSILEVTLNGPHPNPKTIGYEDWCTAPNKQKLLVGDWNGDGFTDLLCHHQTGEMKVLINQAGQMEYMINHSSLMTSL